MTSNLGSQQIQAMVGDEYQVVKLAVMAEVKAHFRPEFINRIDEVVVFHALDETNIARIADIQLARLRKRLEAMDMGLVVTEAALSELAKAGFDPLFGARPLKRAIQKEVQDPLARMILENRIRDGETVEVTVEAGGLALNGVPTAMIGRRKVMN